MEIFKLKYDLKGLSDSAVAKILQQAKEKAKDGTRVIVKRDGKKVYDSQPVRR
jgi:ferritin-like protein